MSLEGTNSYVLRAEGSEHAVIVDPGPDDAGHLAALAAESVELILITHRHRDHTEGIDTLHRLTGAPVRAALPEHCRDGSVLVDGEEIHAAGLRLRVLATPGHTSDSLSFLLPDDGATRLDAHRGHHPGPRHHHPRCARRNPGRLPGLAGQAGGGPRCAGAARRTARCWTRCMGSCANTARTGSNGWPRSAPHSRRSAAAPRQEPTIAQVTDVVYADVDPLVRRAAEISVAAQLHYLKASSKRS